MRVADASWILRSRPQAREAHGNVAGAPRGAVVCRAVGFVPPLRRIQRRMPPQASCFIMPWAGISQGCHCVRAQGQQWGRSPLGWSNNIWTEAPTPSGHANVNLNNANVNDNPDGNNNNAARVL